MNGSQKWRWRFVYTFVAASTLLSTDCASIVSSVSFDSSVVVLVALAGLNVPMPRSITAAMSMAVKDAPAANQNDP